MNRTDLIKFLITYRMSRAGMAAGLPEALATAQAEDVVRRQVTDYLTATSTPDGAIAWMVETYLAHVAPIAGGVFDVENPPDTAAFKAANDRAIQETEAHRSQMWPGDGEPPQRFPDYVFYRVRLEVRAELGLASEEMGLGAETVTAMIKFCIIALAPEYAKRPATPQQAFLANLPSVDAPDRRASESPPRVAEVTKLRQRIRVPKESAPANARSGIGKLFRNLFLIWIAVSVFGRPPCR